MTSTLPVPTIDREPDHLKVMRSLCPPADAVEMFSLDVAIADASARLAPHVNVHPKPWPGCPFCPAVACACGSYDCTDSFEHQRLWGASETSWRELAQ